MELFSDEQKSTIEADSLMAAAEELRVRIRKSAKQEKVDYDLSAKFFLHYLRAGIREFFGVDVDFAPGQLVSEDDLMRPFNRMQVNLHIEKAGDGYVTIVTDMR